MKIDIKNLEIPDGDILLIKQPTTISDYDMSIFFKSLSSYIGKETIIIILRRGMELTTLNETQMNEAGWFRQ